MARIMQSTTINTFVNIGRQQNPVLSIINSYSKLLKNISRFRSSRSIALYNMMSLRTSKSFSHICIFFFHSGVNISTKFRP